MIGGGQIGAEPLDLLADQVVDDLRVRAGMAVEVRHVVARLLRPVVALPAGVQDDDVPFTDRLRRVREHLVEPVETPAVGHGAQVDDEAGTH